MKRELTVIEAGMAETIKQLEKDKAELVEAIETFMDAPEKSERDEYSEFYAMLKKHGSNQ